ncbi:MAG: four helix bundle protein, partial [Candidatus Pacearchaeota archaeon]|nr:four helix bundle protein [Candidatus Pacearchaeota archaeon]
VRAATSIGANYREADEAYSSADYSYKVGIAKKEAREANYWLMLLKYTIDLRLSDNRSSFIFGAHSDYYADDFYEKAPNATPRERRQGVEEVIDYALTKSTTRVVSVKEMIDWIKNPVSLK